MLNLPKIAKIYGLDPAKLRSDRARGALPLSGREEGKNPSYGPEELVAFALHEELLARNFTRQSAAREVVVSDAPFQVLKLLKEGDLTDCLLVLYREPEEHPKIRGLATPLHRHAFVKARDLPDHITRLAPRVGSFTVIPLVPLWNKLVARAAVAGVALYANGEMIIETDAE